MSHAQTHSPIGHSPAQKVKRADRRAQVASMYLRGQTQLQIAAHFGVARQQICQDLKIIRALWREQTVRDFDAYVVEQLEKIDHLEATYWEAWERSRQEEVSSSTSRTSADPGAGRASIVRRQRDGDPRFLDGVSKCIEQRRKLLGLDAPAKLLIGGVGRDPDGPGRGEIVDVADPALGLSYEVLDAISQAIQRKREREAEVPVERRRLEDRSAPGADVDSPGGGGVLPHSDHGVPELLREELSGAADPEGPPPPAR